MFKGTWDEWCKLTPAQQNAQRDLSQLTPQLAGAEGCRVEVLDKHGERRRFIVGRSTGWRPVHLEIKTRRSTGGTPVYGAPFGYVRVIERVR